MLNDREVFDLMESASAAALVLDRGNDSVFAFLAEAQEAGIVPHRELADLTPRDAERFREWLCGCATIARHGDEAEWLSGQVIVRLCEARQRLERHDFPAAILLVRLAEFANAMLVGLLLRLEARTAEGEDVWAQIERWR